MNTFYIVKHPVTDNLKYLNMSGQVIALGIYDCPTLLMENGEEKTFWPQEVERYMGNSPRPTPYDDQVELIGAEYAREQSRSTNNDWFRKAIKKINQQIENAYRVGVTYARYAVEAASDYSQTTNRAKMIISELEKKGFKVDRIKGDDQRENSSWDYLTITW